VAERHKVLVRMAGKEYTLVGIESDEYIHKVAIYIDKKMNEIIKMNNRLSTAMVAVLTAVNVADDYFKASDNETHIDEELKLASDEVERQKAENRRLTEENSTFSMNNTDLKLQIAKLEAELREVRNSLNKATGQ
jgi:cell division protein ZapA